MSKQLFLIATILFLALQSNPIWGQSKELIKMVEQQPRETIELPIDYPYLFPTTSFEQWDADYNSFERFLTKRIMKTQMGLSYNHNGVQTWWCMPSARTMFSLIQQR